jgi:hypothetical protein
MLDKLTGEMFQAHLNETFRLYYGVPEPVALTLIDVRTRRAAPAPTPWSADAAPERAPFSIVFQGPPESPLGQGMYRLENDALGTLDDLFLVPIGANQRGRFYEAVFN